MAWVTAHTDNPLFTYEMRTRTRDGRWYDNLIIAGVLLPLVVGLAARYPDVIGLFSFFAVLGFFHGGSPLGLLPPTAMQAYADLAALLLSIEFYVLALRGQVIGEALFWKDQERGTLGGLLLTPLTSGQLFWGKVWGQSSGYVASWAICGAVGLLLYGLASPLIGLGPALGAWAMSQAFIAAAFILGMGLGTALAAHTLRFRVLRGLSTLLLIFAYGAGFRLFIWPDLFATPLNPAILLTHRLAFGTLYALVLAVLAFAYAHWRVVVLRHRDMAFGEGAAG